MIYTSYLFCGILYSIYLFSKIFSNFENFITILENEFREEVNLTIFLSMLFLNCIFAWPILAIQEINNIQDL